MFLELDKKDSRATALLDSNEARATYGDIMEFAERFRSAALERCLIFALCNNCVGAAMGYIAAMCNRVVPLLLSASLSGEMLDSLIRIYEPKYIWKPISMVSDEDDILLEGYGYALVPTWLKCYPLYDDLSLLLTTSGSTGSPKLVRHSYNNIEAQARNISAFFELNSSERPMIDLPINYTYGLSVLNSHLYSGATALLTSLNVLSPVYWTFLKQERATSFTNVPYAFEILKKLRVFRMDLPYLRTFSQGGGKLSDQLYREFAEYARNTGRRFIPTYGQTEGSARMAYLPPELTVQKCGSIGKAIPNGHLYIIDDDGNDITAPGVTGELAYRGPNVTLGYAQCGDDLILGDERRGVLHTGDIVRTDEDGYFYIIGRKARFVKLWGYRVSLDECESLINDAFETQCACIGADDIVYVYTTCRDATDKIKKYISGVTSINTSAFCVRYIEELPRNEAGKILYSVLEQRALDT